MTPEDLCRVTANVHCAAEHVAELHAELGPQAAAVAAALTLLNSPTIYSLLRRVAVKSVAALLTIGDATLNTSRACGQNRLEDSPVTAM